MPSAGLFGSLDQRNDVRCVVRDESAPFIRCNGEKLGIGRHPKLGSLVDGDDVVAAAPELLRDRGRVVRVEQELHAKSACRRRHIVSTRFAALVIRAVHASISSWYSA
jgi:hypothetical protein